MLQFISFAATAAATLFGYLAARRFVEDKLRYVDGIHTLRAPIVAGVVAAIVAAPIVWLLPLVGGGTAILFGTGVALGVANGSREVRKRITAG
ncbi:MAG: hypothetical protein KGL38_04160 [Gemmatimonadota bacterium]|nr:hypothetical protein [Gemmatimonadota bacterium]MDE3216629.1 hypothetical protein [Gemmatimonadota bacterium]